VRISRGVRYRRSFPVSLPLSADDQTLALLPLNLSGDQSVTPDNSRIERVHVQAGNP
jgi:hypothetical protein